MAIGSSDPAGAALRVAGTVRADAFNGPVAASHLTGTLTASQLSTSTPSAGQVLGYNGSAMVWQAAGGGSDVWSLSGTSAYYNGGNVGIGTTDPHVRLHVNGAVLSGQDNTLSGREAAIGGGQYNAATYDWAAVRSWRNNCTRRTRRSGSYSRPWQS